jgi:hypothetical protein
MACVLRKQALATVVLEYLEEKIEQAGDAATRSELQVG